MIGSVSSSSFAHYGMQRHSHGERSPAVEPQKEEPGVQPPEKTKKKEEEEKISNPQGLDKDEKEQVEKLKQRDREVRTHEQAHMAAAGSLAMGGPSYVFQTGPDGKQYAIGGSVKIDTSPGRTPEESAKKAQQIRAAALAPADPSGQDLKVAASAANMETEAATKTAEKAEKDANKLGGKSDANSEDGKGEITSSRQVFAASPSDSEQGPENGENSESRPNSLLMQAAQLYQSRMAKAEA